MSQLIRVRYAFYTMAIVATWLVKDHPFFWDTIQLGSKQAHFFFENGFGSFILPSDIDSGHPPFFGAYLAMMWKLFGKTLAVSHFAMLPFLLGNVLLLSNLAMWLRPDHRPSWLLLFVFADPVFASQSILVSPDIVLVFFFMACLHGIFSGKRWLIALGATGLAMISTRGMMVAFALGLFYLPALVPFKAWKWYLRQMVNRLALFFPAALAGGGFLLYHYLYTGWIGYHAASTWAPSFERVDFYGFLRNTGLLVWRMLDFGRVFIWLVVAWLVYQRTAIRGLLRAFDQKEFQLLKLLALLALCLLPAMALHKGLSAHRYLLPLLLTLTFFFVKILPAIKDQWYKLAIVALFGLLSGNFWIYPKNIAMGWDATLAHLPWYPLQKEMLIRIAEQPVPLGAVGSAFPNIGPREFIELNGQQDGFKSKDLDSDCFILYSNVMNDFTDAEIKTLESKWQAIETLEKGGVCLILYKHPTRCEN